MLEAKLKELKRNIRECNLKIKDML